MSEIIKGRGSERRGRKLLRHSAGIMTLLAVMLLGNGCASTSAGFPARSIDEKKDLQALENKFATSDLITNFNETKEERNKIINGRMALINANYRDFLRSFVYQKQVGDTSTEIFVIGLNTAGSLITPSSTTNILSGISAALTGSKASFDKNFYYEQTVRALYAAMQAERKKVELRILQGMKKEIDVYPLTQALMDLNDLYDAGTFLGALSAVQKDADVKEGEQQKKIDQITGFTNQVLKDLELMEKIIAAKPKGVRTQLKLWYDDLGDESLLKGIADTTANAIANDPTNDQLPDWIDSANDHELARFCATINSSFTLNGAPTNLIINVIIGKDGN